MLLHHWVTRKIVYVFFLILMARGLAELIAPKGLVMAAQLVGVTLVIVFFALYALGDSISLSLRGYLLGAVPFVAAVAASVMLTVCHGFLYWIVYFIFTGFLLFMALVMAKDYRGALSQLPFYQSAVIVGWLLLAVALAEHLSLFKMPGSSRFFMIVRPASLTGSFLHYPLIMALLGFVAFQRFALRGGKGSFLSGFAFCLAPFAAASRSGVFVVLFGFLLVLWLLLLRGRPRGALLGFMAIGVGTIALFFAEVDRDTAVGQLVARVTTAASFQAEGNSGRVASWRRGFKMWSETNLLLGEHTGQITNSTGKFFRGETDIVESGLLQQLLNFGLIGMLTFYAILFYLYSLVDARHIWLRAVYLAGMAQTLFYQSIEVVPYMALLLCFPVISQGFQHDALHSSVSRQPLRAFHRRGKAFSTSGG